MFESTIAVVFFYIFILCYFIFYFILFYFYFFYSILFYFTLFLFYFIFLYTQIIKPYDDNTVWTIIKTVFRLERSIKINWWRMWRNCDKYITKDSTNLKTYRLFISGQSSSSFNVTYRMDLLRVTELPIGQRRVNINW